MSASIRIALPVLALAWLASPAMAAPARWQAVATSAGNTVEIDQSRISRLASGKTAAWTRLSLDHPVLDFENQTRYTEVLALNHYDCANRSYSTRKRVYLLDARAIKTEKVANPRQMQVQADSLDAQVLEAACKPRTAGSRGACRAPGRRSRRRGAAAPDARGNGQPGGSRPAAHHEGRRCPCTCGGAGGGEAAHVRHAGDRQVQGRRPL
jgi:carbonic anhydrase